MITAIYDRWRSWAVSAVGQYPQDVPPRHPASVNADAIGEIVNGRRDTFCRLPDKSASSIRAELTQFIALIHKDRELDTPLVRDAIQSVADVMYSRLTTPHTDLDPEDVLAATLNPEILPLECVIFFICWYMITPYHVLYDLDQTDASTAATIRHYVLTTATAESFGKRVTMANLDDIEESPMRTVVAAAAVADQSDISFSQVIALVAETMLTSAMPPIPEPLTIPSHTATFSPTASPLKTATELVALFRHLKMDIVRTSLDAITAAYTTAVHAAIICSHSRSAFANIARHPVPSSTQPLIRFPRTLSAPLHETMKSVFNIHIPCNSSIFTSSSPTTSFLGQRLSDTTGFLYLYITKTTAELRHTSLHRNSPEHHLVVTTAWKHHTK